MLLFYFKTNLNMAQRLTEEEKKKRAAEKLRIKKEKAALKKKQVAERKKLSEAKSAFRSTNEWKDFSKTIKKFLIIRIFSISNIMIINCTLYSFMRSKSSN